MFSNTYKRHFKRTITLALPVALGQIGHMMTSFADAVMVGHIGSVELAAVSLAGSLIIIPTLLLVGISIGLTPLVGKAFGEENIEKINGYFYHGLALNFLLGILLSILVYLSVPYLNLLDQDAEVLEKSIPYFLVMIFSLIPYTFMLTAKQFTEGIALTKPGMYISILGNLLNVGLNYLLIYGKFGFPELGVLGAGIASFIARAFMGVGFIVYVFYKPQISKYIKFDIKRRLEFQKFKEIFKIGLPIGVQFTLEVGVFSVGAIMIGWFGSDALAAHQIALNYAALTFVMASGFATASTIRISNLIGQRKLREMRLAGFASMVLVFGFMSVTALIFILFRFSLPFLFTTELNVINEAAKLLLVAAVFQIFDGIQVVGLGNLRGMADVKYPTYVALFSYWFIGIPACYLFGVYFNFGAPGVWIGYLLGLGTAAIFFTVRFARKSKEAISKIRLFV